MAKFGDDLDDPRALDGQMLNTAKKLSNIEGSNVELLLPRNVKPKLCTRGLESGFLRSMQV